MPTELPHHYAGPDTHKADRERLSTFLMSCLLGLFVLVSGLAWLATHSYGSLLWGAVVFLGGAFISAGIVQYRYPKPRRK